MPGNGGKCDLWRAPGHPAAGGLCPVVAIADPGVTVKACLRRERTTGPSAFPPGLIPPAGSVGSYPSRELDIRERKEKDP